MRGRDIIVEPIRLADIFIVGERRALNTDAVDSLALSIETLGLRHPITIRYTDYLNHPDEGELHGAYILVAGRHRMAAFEKLDRDTIDCVVIKGDEIDAKLWEIAENLHRSDLSKLQRDEQIAEWVSLTAEKARNNSAPLGGLQPHEAGVRKAATELGVDEKTVRNAGKVASISERAKQAAIENHLDNNQSALLKVAASQPAEQVEKVRQIAAERDARKAARSITTVPLAADPISDEDAVEKQFSRLMSAWNAACPEARQRFDDVRDRPVMDRRHG